MDITATQKTLAACSGSFITSLLGILQQLSISQLHISHDLYSYTS